MFLRDLDLGEHPASHQESASKCRQPAIILGVRQTPCRSAGKSGEPGIRRSRIRTGTGTGTGTGEGTEEQEQEREREREQERDLPPPSRTPRPPPWQVPGGTWRLTTPSPGAPGSTSGRLLRPTSLYAGRSQGQAGRTGHGFRIRAGRSEPAPVPNRAQDPIEPAPAGEPHRPRPSLPSRSNFSSSATEHFFFFGHGTSKKKFNV